MTNEEQILVELKKINDQLVKNNPNRVILNNFLAGFFHSFGNFLGAIVLTFALIFVASRYNWAQIMAKSFQTMMSQVDWTKIVPQPTLNIDSSKLFQQ